MVTFTRNDARQHLLTGVINSLGVINKHRFANLQNDEVYTIGMVCTYPYMNLSGKLHILKEEATYVDKLQVSGTSFKYEKGVVDLRGRGFLGFEKITEYDQIKGWNTTRIFDPGNFGTPVSEDSPLMATSYNTSVSVADNKIASIRTTSMSVKDRLKDVTVTHSYSYDSYDNITREVVDYGQGIRTTVGNVYSNYYDTPYRLGLLTEQYTQDERNGSSTTRKLQVSYDAKFQPVSKKELYDGNQVSEEIMVYDSFYNIVEKKTRPYSSAGWLSVKFDYDRYGRQTRKTDALGLTEDYAYDAKGMPSSIKNHKGQLTVYEYNAWNQKVKETYPDGTRLSIKTQWAPAISSGIVTDTNIGADTHVHELSLSTSGTLGGTVTACESISLKPGFSYSSANGGNLVLKIDPTIHVDSPSQYTNAGTASYMITTQKTGTPLIQSYYDALGRVLRTGEMRFDGKYLYTDNVYDREGRIQKTSLPFRDASPSLWNTYQYDSYGRITRLSYASGKEDTYSYDGNSVTSVIDNVSTTKVYDASGETVKITDPSGTIKFYLRPDRQTERIVSPGGIVTDFEYDALGRQTAIVDASAGRKTYGYDTYGNINRETNADGSSVRYMYDIYGRMTEKEIAGEQTIRYDFDADGLLTGETGTNGTSKAYTYDAYFRLATEKESVTDGKWFQKAYTYSDNNLSSTAYSANTGSIVTENYAYSYGSLTRIKLNNAIPVWKLVSENNLGMATRAETGILSRSYTFDEYGHPVGRSIKNGSSLIQDFSYNFDAKTGNLNWRKDNGRKLQEDFVYDNLNRLTHFNGNVITYDVKGNITDHTGVGKFGYGREKPFAIETVSPYGGSIPMRNQQINYNAQMRPSSITENGYAADFTYNGDGDRVRMRIRKDNADELVRYYMGNQYEIETGVAGTKERLYLGGDAYTAAAVYVRDGNGGWTVNFIGRDYLGSITHVISENGQLRQELSYDPWGRLRNPVNQELYATDTEPVLLLGRGFTGHEHLTMFGLVNMNARLYDPVLGRFLSPDPYVQNPFFSQNYNRYSYGWNNPLRFTDPTGEWFLIDDLIAAGVGGIVNVLVNAIQGNIHSWGQGFSYFGVGAAGTWVGLYAGPIAGGAIIGAGNSFVTQGFGSDGKWNWSNIDGGQVLMAGVTGAAMSYLGSQATGLIAPQIGQYTSSIKGAAFRGAVEQGLIGSATGFALGTGVALANGESLGDALKTGGQGAALGFATGAISGMASGLRSAYKAGENPWNGEKKISNTVQNKFRNHALSKGRHNDLELNDNQILEKSNELIMKNRSNFLEGDNTMIGKINGIDKSFKVYLRDGKIISTNIYPRISNRVTNGNIIRYGNLKW